MPALRDFIDGPWRAVPVLGVTQILSWGTIFYTPVLIVPLIAAERGWSMSFAMGGFSVGLLAAGLSAPYVGRSIDRFGGHVVMTIGSLIGALGLVLIGLTADRISYLAVWVVLGVAMAANLYDSAFATLGRVFGAGARSPIPALTLAGGFAPTVSWLATHLSRVCRAARRHIGAAACVGLAARPLQVADHVARRRTGAAGRAAAIRIAVHPGRRRVRDLCLRSLGALGASAGDLRALRHRRRNGGVDRCSIRTGASRRAADRVRLRRQSASVVGGALRVVGLALRLRHAGGTRIFSAGGGGICVVVRRRQRAGHHHARRRAAGAVRRLGLRSLDGPARRAVPAGAGGGAFGDGARGRPRLRPGGARARGSLRRRRAGLFYSDQAAGLARGLLEFSHLLHCGDQPGAIDLEELGKFRRILIGRRTSGGIENPHDIRALDGLPHRVAQPRDDRVRHPLGGEDARPDVELDVGIAELLECRGVGEAVDALGAPVGQDAQLAGIDLRLHHARGGCQRFDGRRQHAGQRGSRATERNVQQLDPGG